MRAHDANDASWYVLRYPEDFATAPGVPPDPAAPFALPSAPYLAPTLLFDQLRGVLELQPEASPVAAGPPPGVAVDAAGAVYRVDETGTLVEVLCDGTRRPLPCEPGILAQPAGLAFDRRGLMYVADPPAHRVVVLHPCDESVRAILGGGGPVGALMEPIDVAVAPSGLVFVADRNGGRIAIFSAGFRPLAAFPTAGAPGKDPKPIALMVDANGSLLVADAWLPRLLRYQPDGTRLGDLDLSTLVAPLAGGDLALGALDRAYRGPLPRLLIGTCGPCTSPADQGAERIAEVHRALRLLALSLGRRFEPNGAFISRALDGGRPGVPWHRIELELAADPPPGARVAVETFTSEVPIPEAPTWDAPRDGAGQPEQFSTDRPEQLVQSPRGRYLWVRVLLATEDGAATPSVRAVRVYYPRVSWLDLLPAAYRRDPESAVFLDRFLALFEHIQTGIEDRFDAFSRDLNPDAAPQEWIDWLGALIDLAFDPSWPVARRRALVAEAMALYRTRGTIAGIERMVEIYTGRRPLILEDWLERPPRPAYLGRPGVLLGCGLPILGPRSSPAWLPESELWALYAHRFTLYCYLDDPCDAPLTLRAVERIIEANKPAHTTHRLQAIYPDARVGVQCRVGMDLVIADGVVGGAVRGADLALGQPSDGR